MPRLLCAFALLAVLMPGCHPGVDNWDNDPRGNFDALWATIDRHYCFLDEKGVDWDEVYARYSPRVTDRMTQEELFIVCSEMLDELRDGHVNLSSPYATSYYRAWWSDYPRNYDARLIEQYYLNFNYRSLGVFDYGFLSGNVGYLRCSSFSSGLGEGNLDYILSYFASAQGIIIDIRDNGGGSMTNVETLARRFVGERRVAGYISHKTGPGHSDFSTPRAYYITPIGEGHINWGKPVVVLTNRGTFSAANNFASVMKCVPGVTLVGAATGGGSGMPFSYEIPCGWGIRFSACSVLDAEGRSTESGVTPHVAVDMDMEDAMGGIDTILETAIAVINNNVD